MKYVLSICMIVKNEEKNLERCLKSLQTLRDNISNELIIVDTGSNDGTVEIAKQYTDKVYFREWNYNFSDMRNISISYASGEWILIIDADELIHENAQNMIEFLKSKERKKFGAALVTVKNLMESNNMDNYGAMASPRLFKNDGNFKYEGSVHNQPVVKNRSFSRLSTTLLHYGYISNDTELMDKKFNRTRELLQRELDKNPEHVYFRYQLSCTYRMHENRKEALDEIVKAYDTIRKNKLSLYEYIYVVQQAAFSYDDFKMYDKVKEVCKEGIEVEKEFIDLHAMLAVAEANLGNPNEAINEFETYLKLIENYNNLRIVHDTRIQMYTLGKVDETYYNLFVLYRNKSNNEKALEYAFKLDGKEHITKILAAIVDSSIAHGMFNELVEFYKNKIIKNNSDLERDFLINIERKKNSIDEDKKSILYNKFSEIDNLYGKLSKIRADFIENNKNLESSLLGFVSNVNFNATFDFYGDLIYYLISLKKHVVKTLDNIHEDNLNVLLQYINNSFKDTILTLCNYLKHSEENDSIENIRINKILLKNVLLSNKLSEEEYFNFFIMYLKNGIDYVCRVYSKEIIDNRKIHYLKNTEEIFLYYMYLAFKHKKHNADLYISNIKIAHSFYPEMKKGLEILINEIQNPREKVIVNPEMEKLKLQLKEKIKNLINLECIEEAKQLIDEYEQVVKDDMEIVLFKSEILLKKSVNTKSEQYKM